MITCSSGISPLPCAASVSLPCFYFTIQPKVCTLTHCTMRSGYKRTEQNWNSKTYNWLIILAAQGPIPLPGIPNKMTHGAATEFRANFYHAECSRCCLEPRANIRKNFLPFSPFLSFHSLSQAIPPMSTCPNPLFLA